MQFLRNGNTTKSQASIAQVSFSSGGEFGALSSIEARGVPMFAPRGIHYRPCEGDRLMLLNVDGMETCVGTLCVADGIDGGELKLSSAGGATAIFKNNGEIHLNGLIITRDGKISEKDKG